MLSFIRSMKLHFILVYFLVCIFIKCSMYHVWNLVLQALESSPYNVIPPLPPILDSTIVDKKFYYLIDWLGYIISYWTWELVKNLANLGKLSPNSTINIPICPSLRSCIASHGTLFQKEKNPMNIYGKWHSFLARKVAKKWLERALKSVIWWAIMAKASIATCVKCC